MSLAYGISDEVAEESLSFPSSLSLFASDLGNSISGLTSILSEKNYHRIKQEKKQAKQSRPDLHLRHKPRTRRNMLHERMKRDKVKTSMEKKDAPLTKSREKLIERRVEVNPTFNFKCNKIARYSSR